MLQSVNFPLCAGVLEEYGGWDGLRIDLRELGLNGVEGIPVEFPRDLLTSCHLTFFLHWRGFCREDHTALRQKSGRLDDARRFYGGMGANALMDLYRAVRRQMKTIKRGETQP